MKNLMLRVLTVFLLTTSLKNNYRLQRELINCISDTQNEEIKKALLGEGLDDKERVSAILSLKEENPAEIADVLQTHYKYGGVDWELNLGSDFNFSLEQVDSLIRDRFCFSEAVINQALENVIESPDKQIAEFQDIEKSKFVQEYDSSATISLYKEEVAQTLYDFANEDWLEEMADYVTENGFTPKDDIVKAEDMIWDFIQEKVLMDENADLPLARDEEILLNLKETMGNNLLDKYYNKGLQLSDYFTEDSSAEFYVKDCYARETAIETLDIVVDSIAEKVCEVLNERETEKADVDYDD